MNNFLCKNCNLEFSNDNKYKHVKNTCKRCYINRQKDVIPIKQGELRKTNCNHCLIPIENKFRNEYICKKCYNKRSMIYIKKFNE